MAPWSGVVLSSARLSPKDDIDFELVRMNAVPTVVRKLDERTIEYSTDPSTIRVTLAYGDDPWVRSVDPRLYQRWVQELGTEPVSFLICSGQFSHLPEYLLMWLAWRMQVRHSESRVEAWDFPTSQFAPVEFIDWSHVIAVVEGREALRAIERADQFVPGTRVDRWLFAILRSIWLNEIRSKRIREGAGFVDAADALTTDGGE